MTRVPIDNKIPYTSKIDISIICIIIIVLIANPEVISKKPTEIYPVNKKRKSICRTRRNIYKYNYFCIVEFILN